MKLKYKDMIKALADVETERNIPVDVIKEALKEAMAKAYKKNAELSDIEVVAEINEKTQTIDLFQYYTVVEEVEDYELEMTVEEARAIKKDAQLGDKVCREIEIESMSRAAASLARNVMRQKIREAEKIAVYNEYIDKLNEMVNGTVESVKEKFTLINLGKTVAMMPHSAGLPGERVNEGQQLRVVITEVDKDTKGSQVLVSRADPMLVKRLFEKEVPEIYNGTVEIKAIAREAGERTKMAVMSHNPDVDPIGACIGPRGQRVQVIINELNGEKVDIFQWNDDLTELVKNALAPASVKEVLPGNDEHSLLVIVDEDQLSLAIGKRGKNARLAVKLTNHKIDIKTKAELEEMGVDYEALRAQAEAKKQEYAREAELKAQERAEREMKEAQKKRAEAVAKLLEKNGMAEESDEVLPEEMMDHVSEKVVTEMTMEEEPAVEETPVEETAEESAAEVTEAAAEVEETVETEEEPAEEESTVRASRHADLEEMAAKNTYVSVFEKLADTSKPKQDSKPKRRKKSEEEDQYKVSNKELQKKLKAELVKNDNRPIYTEEELEEIEAKQREEEESEYDYYDEDYDDYYEEDNN